MKLSELKVEVYRMAGVTTTRQLKAQYANVKPLDLRYKAAWVEALKLLKTGNAGERASSKKTFSKTASSKKATPQRGLAKKQQVKQNAAKQKRANPEQANPEQGEPKQADFEAWLNNPPEAYKALFAEADEALAAFDDKLSRAKRLTKTAKLMADSLDEFADASVEEAKQLAEIAQRQRETAEQVDLN